MPSVVSPTIRLISSMDRLISSDVELCSSAAVAMDATTDTGLEAMAARAGLTPAYVAAALADESWRAIAEVDRQALLDEGLWGVPSFRVGDRPAHWGQDRLWAVEADLAAVAGDRT